MSVRTHIASVLLAVACAIGVSTPAAEAVTRVTLSGPQQLGPISPDANGRFAFPNVPLRRNSVNVFTITASDDTGQSVTQDLTITQLSLESVVVSKVTAVPLSVQEVEQLVSDGVIKLDDPQNFNVSKFEIVLTIGQEVVPISIPVALPKEEEQTGWETYRLPRGDGSGGGKPRPRDTEVIIFQQEILSTVPERPIPPVPGVIVIEGRIKSLKEFFSVRLLLMNTSGIFTLAQVKADIAFPNGGLSSTLPADGIVSFDEILPGTADQPGQAEREFIIRGDQIGVRPVKVSFGGVVTGPGIPADSPVPFNGSAQTSVEVKGPPAFQVQVKHPPLVVESVPYELTVDITNTGDMPALYASLEVEVGADATLVNCTADETTGDPDCAPIEGPSIRNLGHIWPGRKVSETFTVLPLLSGAITSCMGVSDQNITLQVFVGNIGCLTGRYPPQTGVPDGIPTVTVMPVANALGVGIDSPVTAIFSELMDEATITTGAAGSMRVVDGDGANVPGQLRFVSLSDKTVAIWQVKDNITNRLTPNTEYTVYLTQDIRDRDGNPLMSPWTSQFTTTSPIDDHDPPTLTLSIEPPIDPAYVLPGQIVEINAYAADQGTGVARIELRKLDVDLPGATFALVDQKTVFDIMQGPVIFSVDSAQLDPGHTYQFKATAYDGRGNTQDATIAAIVAPNADPPAIALPSDPTLPVLHGISVDITPVSVSPGGRTVHFFLDGAAQPFRTITLPPFRSVLSTLGLGLGDHTVRAVAVDGLGQTGEDTLAFTLAENLNMPAVSFGTAVDGTRYISGRTFSVSGTATDPVGIRSVEFFLDQLGGLPIASGTQPFTIDTTNLATGAHQIHMMATNQLGVSNDPLDPASILDFEVVPLPNGPPPPAPTLDPLSPPLNGRVTVSGTSVPSARIDIGNVTRGLVSTISANTGGGFSGTIAADPGDLISAVAFDFSQSQQPSAAATAAVPAPPVLQRIEVLPATFTLTAAGQVQALTVTAFYDDGTTPTVTAQATFTSSAPAVASVGTDGRVVAHSSGMATITVQFAGQQAVATATVSIVTLVGIQVSPSPLDFTFLNETATLTVTGQYSDGSTASITSGLAFASGNTSVATVTSAGLVTAKGNGSTLIFVSAAGVVPVAVPVTVVAQDPAPTVQILSPADGTPVERGDIIGVAVQANDVGGGVVRVTFEASGEAALSDVRQVQPPALVTLVNFSFVVPNTATVGGTIVIRVRAEDTSGNLSNEAVHTLTVVDTTAPAVTITAPAADTAFNFGDTLDVAADATDGVGVSQIRVEASGAFTATYSQTIAPPQATVSVSIPVSIPFGLTSPGVTLRAFALDAAGNEGASIPVHIVVTDADITPPQTVVTAVADPGGNATAVVTYEVLDGLADLDHVALYFRRNGLGAFNRYTNEAGGNPNGVFAPQSGAVGTIVFDSTRMGGDGVYEFVTVGVDAAGNREPFPLDGSGQPTGDAGAVATFATGVPVVQITSNQEIADGTLDDRNLRISNATVTLVGAHAFRNVELLNGAVLTHRDATAAEEFSLDVNVWTLSIDATSRLDVTGRGYIGGREWDEAGRTLGNTAGSGRRNGGSYGGLGGHDPSVSEQPNALYGDLTEPLSPGSGGGADGNSDGGDGGGLALVGAINLVVDGALRADGGVAPDSRSGMGSGGTVNVRTRTLSGRGTIEADGGTKGGANNVGGGGGRIAVRYLDMVTFDRAGITATGGDGYYADGGDGTVFLKQETEPNGELVINGTTPSAPFTTLIIPPGQSFDSVTLQNYARVIADGAIALTQTLRLRGNSILTHPNESEAGLQITAARVHVEAGSAIDASGRGYRGGRDWDEAGMTLGNVAGSGSRNGGSHGGFGAHDASVGEQPNAIYGDPRAPDRLGSGGGADGSSDGGDGGGLVRIVASEEVVVDGAVRADGGVGWSSRAGMGAGGSVWITTSRLAGTGTISASGGNRGGSNNTGGGGGRIALYADYIDASANFDALRNIQAFRGRGYYDSPPGSAGTVFIKLTGATDGDLVLDDNMAGATSATATPLHLIGPGTAAAVTADTLTTDGGVALFPNALVGLRLNPNTTQSETFAILSNAADAITVATPNEHGVAFADVAAVGARYAGFWRFDNVFFRRGAHLVVGDPLFVTGTLAVADFGLLTQPATTTAYEGGLDLTVETLTVDATSRIDVSARGYVGGAGWDDSGRTLGNAFGAGRRNGGSHGGLGGHDPAVSEQPSPQYGSVTDPRDLGSGGGADGNSDGGAGGGRIIVVANTVANDGAVRADGGTGHDSRSGMGSGGTVNLTVQRLDGSGTIEADGGTRGGGNNVGGGGGRVAVHFSDAMTLPVTNLTARGGDGYYADAGHGTVFVKGPGQMFGDLVVDGFALVQPPDTTRIPGGLTFDSITLRNGVRAVAEDGLSVTGSLRLSGNSTLTHDPESEAGLAIAAARVEVEAGSAIDVSGRGYRGGRSWDEKGMTLGNLPGSGRRNGGSHGGLGAHDPAVSEQPGPVYGDPRAPDRLGSGGGADGNSGGGAGGGFVRIVVSDEVVVDGAVRADGAVGWPSRAGMGAGGSVWITTSRLSGTGEIKASGGNRDGANNAGGGGGRIAVYADDIDASSAFADLGSMAAFRGRGYVGYENPPGSAGTVFVKLAGRVDGDLVLDDNMIAATSPNGTPLHLIGPGTAAAVSTDTLTTDGVIPLLPNALVGLRLNPDTAQAETFAILTNTADAITVVTPNEHGVAFADVAAVGARYAGFWRFDNVFFRRGAHLVVGDLLHVTGTLELAAYALLTHPETTTTYEAILDVTAGTLTIDATSTIEVSGRGYVGGQSWDESGRTLGNAYGAGRNNGGSYGGLGGHDPIVGEQPNPTYGSATDPRDPGSGGGANGNSDGGDGGGRIIVVADTMVNDGVLRANGSTGTPSRAGMGSGGTVNLSVRRLEGGGAIEANGGTLGGTNGVGGGGGRIGIMVSEAMTLPVANLSVAGGDGYYADGQPGTVAVTGP